MPNLNFLSTSFLAKIHHPLVSNLHSYMRSSWFTQLYLWTCSVFQDLYFVSFLPFHFFYLPFPISQNKLPFPSPNHHIFSHGIWCLPVSRAFGCKVMSPPKILFTLSLLVMGEMLDRQHWCCARAAQQLPKTWCVISIFPAANAQHCESCYGGNSLCLWQTQNIHNYSGCLLTTLTGWRKEECY